MKTIYLLFDSLNRAALSTYGGEIETPNFERLASHSAVFDKHYIGSMPYASSKRYAHRSTEFFIEVGGHSSLLTKVSLLTWSKKAFILTSLRCNHYEDGGAIFNRYNTYDFIRGQESDLDCHGETSLKNLRKI